MNEKEFDHLIKTSLKNTAEEISPNPFAKTKMFNAITAKEAFKMRISKKIVIPLILIICLFATTAVATGGNITSWVSSCSASPTYANIEDIEADDLGFEPLVLETFKNGYTFKDAYIHTYNGLDENDKIVCSINQLAVNYQNNTDEELQFTAEIIPDYAQSDDTVYESEQTYNEITLKYNYTDYKLVNDDYVLTEEDEAKIAGGNFEVSSTNDLEQIEYYNTKSISWEIDGVTYCLWGFNYDSSANESELYVMAKEIIDFQLSEQN